MRSRPEAGQRTAANARRLGGQLHAFAEVLDAADRCAPGPLAGCPIAIKDLVDVAGRAPTVGLGSTSDAAPTVTAPVIEQLMTAGAAIIGFTEMTPLAFEPSGGNPDRGRPLNPWNPDAICGGSSSGSAVAAAAGIVPLALGSDTAGSLRIPAHCCGVAAWKPTHGLVPVAGTMPLSPALDVLGFLARDLELLAAVAGVFCPRDEIPPIRTIAVARDVVSTADPFIRDAVAAVERAATNAGYRTTSATLAPLLEACDRPVLRVLQAEAARAHAARLDGLEATLRTRLSKGLSVSDEELAASLAHLAVLRSGIDTLFATADAFLLPVMRITTPPVSACEPGTSDFSPRTLYALSGLTRWVNALGLPAVALPAGFDARGLPIAVQLVGRPGTDLALIRLAAALDHAGGWPRLRPPVFAAEDFD